MSALRKLEWLSPADYLAMEEASTIKHEYVDGQIYAMSGASRAHNLIGLNLVRASARSKRFRKPCEVYASDVKVHIASRNAYYYPDLIVTCQREEDSHSLDRPCLIVEIASPGTAATDRREKRLAYAALTSLSSYVMIEQDYARITVLRRDGSGWTEQILGLTDTLVLDCLELDVPVAEVYAGIELQSVPIDE